MTLDEFLNRHKIERLQRFEIFWTDAMRSSSSKSTLITRLRRAMLTPSLLKSRFQALPVAERRLLEILLNASEGPGPEAKRPEGGPHKQSDGIAELLRSLADKGFISYQPDDQWHNPIAGAILAEEVASALRKMLSSGVRHPEQVLSLDSFARALGPGPLYERVKDLGLFSDEIDDLHRAIQAALSPGSVRARIEALEPPELRQAVVKAIREHFGLLPAKAAKPTGGPLSSEDLAAWKGKLEQCLLGTINSISLEHLGLNVRSDYLTVFLEVAAAYLTEPAEEAVPREHKVTSNGFGLLLDFLHVLSRIQREDLRLTQAGPLRKYGAEGTLDSLLLAPTEDSSDGTDLRAEYLERLANLSMEMELVQRQSDGTLTPGSRAIEWIQQPVVKRAQALIRPFVFEGRRSDEASHAEQLRRQVGDWCRELRPGKWYPCELAARLAVVRYLLHLVRGDLDGGRIAFHTIRSSAVSLEHLADDFLRWLQAEPLLTGIVDLAFSNGVPVLLRTTPVAAAVFGFEWPEGPTPAQPLIVNPDYEIVLFSGGTPPEVHCVVHQMASLAKHDQVFHYRIDETSVATAAALGQSAEQLIAVLVENSRGPVPQNIRYSIESWAGRVHNVTISQAYVLELPSPELVQMVRRLPEIAPYVVRELSPTVLALSEAPTDRGAIRALQGLGIYVRR